MGSTQKKLTAIVFDCDGTLLDTEPLYETARATIAAKYGKDVKQFDESKILGTPEASGCCIFAEDLGLPISGAECLAEQHGIVSKLFATVKPCVGALEMMRHAASLGLSIAVATSSTSDGMAIKKAANPELFKHVSVVVCGDDPEVKKGKPSPDIFLKAAERLGVDPTCCLAFEDSPAGVQAAVSAGMTVVALPAPTTDSSVFPKEAHVAESFFAVPLEDFGLPALPSV